MGNPLKSVPWQVTAVGVGVGAVLVLGYFAYKKLGAVGTNLSDAAKATAKTITEPFSGSGVAFYAFNSEWTYAELMAKGMLDGDALNAAGLRAFMKLRGELNLDGTIPQPNGSSVALQFDQSRRVTGAVTLRNGAEGSF